MKTLDVEILEMWLQEQVDSIKTLGKEDDGKEVKIIDAAQIRMLRIVQVYVQGMGD